MKGNLMEKNYLDMMYFESLIESLVKEGLTQQEIEQYIDENLSEGGLQNFYKVAIDMLPEDIINAFMEQAVECYSENQEESEQYCEYLESIWKKGFELTNAMYSFTLEELALYSDRLEKEHASDLNGKQFKCKVLQLLVNRNLQTFLAIFTLLKNGFADQAFMLFRNMFENRVISEFIRNNNESTAKAFYMAQNNEIVEAGDYEWTKKSGLFGKDEWITFRKIYQKCGFDQEYRDIWYRQYKLACKLVHTTPQGTAGSLALMPNSQPISLVGQTFYGINLAAEHSAIMLEDTVKNYLCLFHDQRNMIFMLVMHKWVGLIQEVYTEIAESLNKE